MLGHLPQRAAGAAQISSLHRLGEISGVGPGSVLGWLARRGFQIPSPPAMLFFAQFEAAWTAYRRCRAPSTIRFLGLRGPGYVLAAPGQRLPLRPRGPYYWCGAQAAPAPDTTHRLDRTTRAVGAAMQPPIVRRGTVLLLGAACSWGLFGYRAFLVTQALHGAFARAGP